MSDQLFPTPPKMTERQWQSTIQKRLDEEGWAFQHVYRLKTASGQWRTSTTSVGWPDLVALRSEYIVAIECKKDKRQATSAPQAQLRWLATFAEIPTGRAWLLDPLSTDWQALANWLHHPETAPRIYGWDLDQLTE